MHDPGTIAHPSHDPAECWELPCLASEGDSLRRDVLDVFPRSPRRAEEVPPDALRRLGDRCRVTSLQQLFVVPSAVRSTGVMGQRVRTPDSVLALGSRAAGLWTELPEPGVKVLIPLDRLAAIEDVTILLYGRLSLVSFEATLTIRYNTLARFVLRTALAELRERVSGAPQSLPVEAEPGRTASAQALPVKWRRLLRGTAARFREDMPVAFRFAVQPPSPGCRVERGQLLVLNPHELMFLCDPREASHNYGEDSFTVPRPRITGARTRPRYLEVASNGARLRLEMAPELRSAAMEWLA